MNVVKELHNMKPMSLLISLFIKHQHALIQTENIVLINTDPYDQNIQHVNTPRNSTVE